MKSNKETKNLSTEAELPKIVFSTEELLKAIKHSKKGDVFRLIDEQPTFPIHSFVTDNLKFIDLLIKYYHKKIEFLQRLEEVKHERK